MGTKKCRKAKRKYTASARQIITYFPVKSHTKKRLPRKRKLFYQSSSKIIIPLLNALASCCEGKMTEQGACSAFCTPEPGDEISWTSVADTACVSISAWFPLIRGRTRKSGLVPVVLLARRRSRQPQRSRRSLSAYSNIVISPVAGPGSSGPWLGFGANSPIVPYCSPCYSPLRTSLLTV